MNRDVVCFHGARSMPPTAPGTFPDLTAEEYAEALHLCWGACRHVKVFGGIHGFPGLEMQEPIRRRGGTFAALVRDPITKLHSLYSSYAAQVEDVKIGDDVYEPLSNEMHLYTEFNGTNDRFELEHFSREFFTLARGIIKEDMNIMGALDDSHIFRYEKITKDRHYFSQCFENLVAPFRDSLPEIKKNVPEIFEVSPVATDQYLDTVFNADKLNKHAKQKKNASEIFTAWPGFFKYLFAMAIKFNGGESVLETYRKFGYDLPKEYNQIDYTRMSDGLWESLQSNENLHESPSS